MPFDVTVTAAVPEPAAGREWLATALLEAPEQHGPWTAIEAAEGAVTELASRHATHEDGWFCLQWHDDGNVSKFSDPVRRGDTAARRRRLGGS